MGLVVYIGESWRFGLDLIRGHGLVGNIGDSWMVGLDHLRGLSQP